MKSKESFKKWCEKKIKIDSEEMNRNIQNWEFWTYNVWVNIWWEMSVEEPFVRIWLILNAKLEWDMVLICPLSTQFWEWFIKEKYYLEIEDYKKYWISKKSYFVQNQIKTISKKRLLKNLSLRYKNWFKPKKFPWELREKIKNFFREEILKI